MDASVVGALLASGPAGWLLVSTLQLGEQGVEWEGRQVICFLLRYSSSIWKSAYLGGS